MNKNNIKIDNKTREEYGSELTNDQGFIQDWLSMPLNTSNTKLLNLPDKRTGSRSSPPGNNNKIIQSPITLIFI